jgi:hypothetical protein
MTFSAKRRYERYPMDRPLIGHRVYDDVTLTVRGRWHSLGEGGAGAQMSEQLRTGEVIRLELSSSIRVYAVVRYGRGFHHGFEFVLLRDRQRAEIKRLCSDLGRDRGEASSPAPGTSWRTK